MMNMAFTRWMVVWLLFSLMLLQNHGYGQAPASETDQMEVAGGAVSENGYGHRRLNCGAACARRCKLSSRPRLCKRACGTCCARCHCVPPGTSGNYNVCSCYARLTTHGNRRKCP